MNAANASSAMLAGRTRTQRVAGEDPDHLVAGVESAETGAPAVAEIAGTLARLAAEGVWHWDIKPDNLLRLRDR